MKLYSKIDEQTFKLREHIFESFKDRIESKVRDCEFLFDLGCNATGYSIKNARNTPIVVRRVNNDLGELYIVRTRQLKRAFRAFSDLVEELCFDDFEEKPHNSTIGHVHNDLSDGGMVQ